MSYLTRCNRCNVEVPTGNDPEMPYFTFILRPSWESVYYEGKSWMSKTHLCFQCASDVASEVHHLLPTRSKEIK